MKMNSYFGDITQQRIDLANEQSSDSDQAMREQLITNHVRAVPVIAASLMLQPQRHRQFVLAQQQAAEKSSYDQFRTNNGLQGFKGLGAAPVSPFSPLSRGGVVGTVYTIDGRLVNPYNVPVLQTPEGKWAFVGENGGFVPDKTPVRPPLPPQYNTIAFWKDYYTKHFIPFSPDGQRPASQAAISQMIKFSDTGAFPQVVYAPLLSPPIPLNQTIPGSMNLRLASTEGYKQAHPEINWSGLIKSESDWVSFRDTAEQAVKVVAIVGALAAGGYLATAYLAPSAAAAGVAASPSVTGVTALVSPGASASTVAANAAAVDTVGAGTVTSAISAPAIVTTTALAPAATTSSTLISSLLSQGEAAAYAGAVTGAGSLTSKIISGALTPSGSSAQHLVPGNTPPATSGIGILPILAAVGAAFAFLR